VYVSVIVPTRNNCSSLRNTVVSLQKLGFPDDRYEIIVIDNNSTDDTQHVVEECSKRGDKELIYFKESRAGLHNARHAGARIAKGEVLAYVDDDVTCDPNWLSELARPYADPKVGCVGGKILPQYETKEPAWAKCYPGFLSILDRADRITTINDAGIWGCNFSIRKSVFYDVGGFHPDAMPWPLIRYRGDGELGLLNKVIEKQYEVVYTPFAVVAHAIPKERVTLYYFKKRAFVQGISDSYTEMRNNGGTLIRESSRLDPLTSVFRRYISYGISASIKGLQCAIFNEIALKYRQKGVKYHRTEVSNDRKLLEFVLQDDYLERGGVQ
jgi:glycosyltransferase involved in cell wall biosynthesis